jgi:hypothetical protein
MHRKTREVTAIGVKEPELRIPQRLDVAEPIKHGKCIAVLQDAGSIVGQR